MGGPLNSAVPTISIGPEADSRGLAQVPANLGFVLTAMLGNFIPYKQEIREIWKT
jgi:hypothetical protein